MSQPEMNMQKAFEQYGLEDEHHGSVLVSKSVSHRFFLNHDLSVVSFTHRSHQKFLIQIPTNTIHV